MTSLRGKLIKVVHDLQAGSELSNDAVAVKKRKQCKDEVVKAPVEEGLASLNLPAAIQQKPTLDLSKANKYQVTSRDA